MTAYTLVNHTDTQVDNVNAANEDVPARSIRTTAVLDTTELAAAVASGLTVLKDGTTLTYQKRREVARVLQYKKAQVIA